ncbi:MAG: sulfate transporter CysZ [Gammaproteobacteria bacterium]|nr:MAG: sulfate transporter CysZ [Gammaproteobacteria bacterium]
MDDIFKGARYLLQGLALLKTPGLRRYVAIPLIINSVLFSLLIYWLSSFASDAVESLVDKLPDLLSFLYWLIMPAFVFILFFLSAYVFNIFANFIAAPFNGLLAEKVESLRTGKSLSEPSSFRDFLKIVPHSLARELAKLKYYLPRVLALATLTLISVVISLIPIVGIIGPIIGLIASTAWFFWGAWMMTIQYMDYPMDNHQTNFEQLKGTVSQRRALSFGFGFSIVLTLSIPIINFVVMPAAVAGATLMWLEEHQ